MQRINIIFIFPKDYDVPQTERPIPRPPSISVVISSPVIQIIDVGETVRLPCTGYHNIKRVRKQFSLVFSINGMHFSLILF